MFVDLGHIAIAANDLTVSLAFYRTLGLPESFRLHRDDGSLMLVYVHIGGDRFLEIFPNGPEPDIDRVQSFRHICLVSDDLKGDVERIRALGITIDREPVLGKDGNWQAWTKDPDGNAIEMMQLSEDSPQRRIGTGRKIAPTPIIRLPE